jgi:WD40 repeat protein
MMASSAKTSTKVFISYSRKDDKFTRKLYEGLEAHKMITWVDWEDIPLTADWMEEIRDAIESSDAFVFVLSPDSVESEICQKELEIALANNKRLVPILHRELTRKQLDSIHPELAATNWVFMREKDNFKATLNQLVEVMNTDLDWVKEHTRLLERAIEWDRRSRNTDFTLRGADLEDAEHWLTKAKRNRKPIPTMLQNEYILVSRREFAQRQRQALVVTFGLLVLAVIATIVAVFQWRNAELQKDVAISRVLAARSIINLDSAPDQALLLAQQARLINDSLESHTSIISALANHPELNKFLHGHQGEVYAAVFGPDGAWLATAGDGSQIFLWDMMGGQLIQSVDLETDAEIAVRAMALSPDGQVLAVGESSGIITFLDTATWDVAQTLSFHKSAVNDLAFSPDGQTLASAGNSVIIWDLSTGSPRYSLSGHTNGALSVAFSPDGSTLASGDAESDIYIWDTNSYILLHKLTGHTGEVNALAFSPDGLHLYSAGRDGRILDWDTMDYGSPAVLEGHTANILALAISPDGRFMASASEDQSVILWALAETGMVQRDRFTAHTNFVNAVAFSPDGSLLSSTSNQTVILWNTAFSGFGHLRGHTGIIRRVELSPDGKTIASAGEDGIVNLWNTATGQLERTIQVGKGQLIFGMDYSGDGVLLATTEGNGQVKIWNSSSGALVDEFTWEGGFLVSVSLNQDGSLVAISAFGRDVVKVWNRSTGQVFELKSDSGEGRNWRWVDFSPDGSLLAAGDFDHGMAIVWDVASKEVVNEWQAHDDAVTQVLFDPKGERLATVSFDNTAKVWNYETGLLLSPLDKGHSDYVHGVAFSPDGSMLVTASEDKSIVLWDLGSGDPVATLTAHQGAVITVDFGKDGLSIVSGSSDHDVIVWDIDLERAGERVCQLANRNFSREEWDSFIGFAARDYEVTCPGKYTP